MLKITNLCKKYKGSEKGVQDINIHVEKGDIYALLDITVQARLQR